MALRDALLTTRVANAMTSPGGLIAAGAGVSIGVLAGAPIAVVAALGAAGWAARVGVAAIPRDRGERIDPFTLKEPWRHYVQDALQARNRYRSAVADMRGGPMRDRLQQIGKRVDDGVDEVWRIAGQGHSLERALKQIDVTRARAELEELEEDARERWAKGSDLEAAAAAKRAELASAERMQQVIAETLDRLRLLDARLEETVARAIELSVGPVDEVEVSRLSSAVDDVVTEMEALRMGMNETKRAANPPPDDDLGSGQALPG